MMFIREGIVRWDWYSCFTSRE